MIFFTADTHFLHKNICEYSNRPFDSIEEMTETIVNRWNAVVAPGDTVFHLGDFAISYGKKHEKPIDDLLSRLNGNKWLIYGNHDREEVKKNSRWVKVLGYHELKVDLGGDHKTKIVLSHYAMRTWNQSHRGSFMLHGHSHGNLEDIGGRTMDVGVDCHNFWPISIDQVNEFMKDRHHEPVDHHA